MEIEYREKNIFYNVIRNETSLTEVLCNLMQYKIFRNLFLNFVNDKTKNLNLDFDDIKYKNFDTEKDFNIQEDEIDKNVGRGDLILNIDKVDYIFEIKIENTTRTTKNQPDGYLKYLKKQNQHEYKKRLFFIIPKGYLHKKNLDKLKENILYWEDFLETIEKAELNKVNILIEEFCKILNVNWFYYEEIEFISQELNLLLNQNKIEGTKLLENMNVPNLMKKLFSIVDEVKLDTNKNPTAVKHNSDYYGYFLKNKSYDIPEKWTFWFGIDFELWAEKNVPIAIQIILNNDEEMIKVKKQLSLEEYNSKDSDITIYYFPLNNQIFQSENIAKELKKEIEKLLEKIKKQT